LQQKRRKGDYTKVYAAEFARLLPHPGAAIIALISADGERGALAAFPEALCRMSNRRFSANLVRPLVYLCAYANHDGPMTFARPNFGGGNGQEFQSRNNRDAFSGDSRQCSDRSIGRTGRSIKLTFKPWRPQLGTICLAKALIKAQDCIGSTLT
jgi:hypothetical protein